ncbi:MAG: hypothetical protein Q7S48_04290 [bacterium]|nr:hypothetical protein [bacterium]
MKREIIPTILVQDRLEFEQRLGIMQGKIPMAQMDIMDGKFVANTTFADPEIAAHFKVDYELDLMVENPGPVLDAWKNVPGVKRAFIHAEIKKPLAPLLKKIKSYGWEAGVALNPDTEWEVVEPYIGHNPSPTTKRSAALHVPPSGTQGPALRNEQSEWHKGLVDCVLFMTVYPGQNGAPFQPKVIPKIASFHTAYSNIPIEVDGGVSEQTLPALLKAGVTRFAVGSAIWSAPDPLLAYKKLLKITNNSLI